MQLDDRDLQILSTLTREGRISKAALAERIGLSPTPCWERLRKLGPHVTVFAVIELSDHTAASFQKFETTIQRYDEVTGCWALGGGFDYLLQVVTRDIDAYQRMIDDMLEARLGLSRYFTYVVTKTVKDPGTLPIDLLASIASGR